MSYARGTSSGKVLSPAVGRVMRLLLTGLLCPVYQTQNDDVAAEALARVAIIAAAQIYRIRDTRWLDAFCKLSNYLEDKVDS